MHPSMGELLAFRDGEHRPDVERHVARCSRCSSQLEMLRQTGGALRELPQFEPPEGAWSVVSEALQRRRRMNRRWRLAAAAAAAVMVALLIGVGVGLKPMPEREAVHGTVPDAQLRELMEASRTLELVIKSPGHRSPVLSASEAARIVVLEDNIAAVDSVLNAEAPELNPSQKIALWTGRVELLNELVRVGDGSVAQRGFTRAVLESEGRTP